MGILQAECGRPRCAFSPCFIVFLPKKEEKAPNLSNVYGHNALQEPQCQRWFTKFRACDFKDGARFWRLNEVDDVRTQALFGSNPRDTTHEIAERLIIHHSSVYDHQNKLGYERSLNIIFVLR